MSANPFILALAIVCVAASGQFIISEAQAAEKITVSYRLANWKTVEINDAQQATKLYATVKQLGCEAQRANHGNHTDISYRCANWRTMEFPSHDAAHNWQRWLRAAGFEAKHAH